MSEEIKEALLCVGEEGICHGYKHRDTRPCFKHRKAVVAAYRLLSERLAETEKQRDYLRGAENELVVKYREQESRAAEAEKDRDYWKIGADTNGALAKAMKARAAALEDERDNWKTIAEAEADGLTETLNINDALQAQVEKMRKALSLSSEAINGCMVREFDEPNGTNYYGCGCYHTKDFAHKCESLVAFDAAQAALLPPPVEQAAKRYRECDHLTDGSFVCAFGDECGYKRPNLCPEPGWEHITPDGRCAKCGTVDLHTVACEFGTSAPSEPAKPCVHCAQLKGDHEAGTLFCPIIEHGQTRYAPAPTPDEGGKAE